MRETRSRASKDSRNLEEDYHFARIHGTFQSNLVPVSTHRSFPPPPPTCMFPTLLRRSIPVYAGSSRTTENSRHSTQKATTKNRSCSFGAISDLVRVPTNPSHMAGRLHWELSDRLHRDERIDCYRVDCFLALSVAAVSLIGA